MTTGLPIAAFVSVCTAVLGFGLLGRTAAGVDAVPRRAYHLMALGTGVAVVGLAGTALLAGPGWRVDTPTRLAPFVLGHTLGVVLLLAGLLTLPVVAPERGAALRLVLDGALIATCVVQVTWTLLVEPVLLPHWDRLGLPAQDPRTVLLGVLLLLALIVTGITAVTAVRVRRPRRVLAWSAVGLAGVALTGLGTLVALRYGDGSAVAANGCGYALCLALFAVAVRRAHRLAVPEPGLPSPGLLLALVPAGAAIAALVLRIMLVGPTDDVSVLLIALIGALATVRHLLANAAAHRFAYRLAEREAHFKEMAFTDALTGLSNRRRLTRVLQERVVGGPPTVLLAIDLDGFKGVNDVRGHDVGDAVLVEVGRRLRANLRPGDLAARLGGDEFAVLMWAGPEEAYRVAQRLLSILGQGYEVDGSPVFLSASIGLAGGGVTDVPTLLHNADLALRFAKQRGKSRVERFDAAYDQWMHRRTTLEQELRGAIEREELSLVYQPVVLLPEARPVGVEALVRWHHPTLGPVSPAEFVPIAEESGLIARVDRWVLHQACHQLSRWQADGHDPWVSVNISVRELHLPDYVSQVVEVLRAHRVPPDRLVLEVTEHSVAMDLVEVVDRLAALRAEGIRIALDDLGAGYSSLGQLGTLPVDLVKIDKHLVIEPAREPARPAAPLVQAVVTLGHQLDLEVVAEGVTSQAQREIVEAAGCRLVQGDFFGAPMPAEHVEALLAGLPLIPAPQPVQDVGQVDSGREMRQS